MKHINQIFFKGLIVVLPITLTFYLLIWASYKVESLFGSGLESLLGTSFYIPGLGILLSLALIFSVGLLVNNYFTGRLIKWLTNLLEKVPLIKAIYNPLKDLMALIPGRSSDKPKPQGVVLVPLPGLGVEVLGLITREELDEIPERDLITVYVPLSYMLGGLTILVERDKVKKIDMPVDQALKLSVTSWIKSRDQDK